MCQHHGTAAGLVASAVAKHIASSRQMVYETMEAESSWCSYAVAGDFDRKLCAGEHALEPPSVEALVVVWKLARLGTEPIALESDCTDSESKLGLAAMLCYVDLLAYREVTSLTQSASLGPYESVSSGAWE